MHTCYIYTHTHNTYIGETESVATVCFIEYDLVEDEEKSCERNKK